MSKRSKKKAARRSSRKKTAQRSVKVREGAVENAGAAAQEETSAVVNKDLHKVLENIRHLQWSDNVRSGEDNYGIGEEVIKVQDDPKRYGVPPGQTAVQFLAKKVGCKKDTLYCAARVARCWTPKSFGQLMKTKGKAGCQLSYAHFSAAAKLDDPKARDEILKKALAENMSTRAVLREVGGIEPKKPKSEAALPSPLVGLIAATERALGQWQNIDEALADDDADALRLLDRASELQHQMSKVCLENSRTLAFRRDSLAASGSVGLEAGELALGAAPVELAVLSASNAHAPAVKQLCSTNPNAEPDPERTGRAPHLETRKAFGKRRKLPISEDVSMPSANSDPAQSGAGGPVPGAEQAPGDVEGVRP